jgi:cell wall-associated NlpC family hydrolase
MLAVGALGAGLLVPAATASATTAAAKPASAGVVKSGTTRPSTAASRYAARAAMMRASAATIGKKKAYRASYVAGAAGPNAFDCSGFTSWVWKQAGHSIPRTSYGQYAALKHISRSAAKPGDLVFFFRGGVHHVGLYLGHGRMVHAANPRSDVLISSIDGPWYGEHFSGFRRVV